jgi:hypothetical protein
MVLLSAGADGERVRSRVRHELDDEKSAAGKRGVLLSFPEPKQGSHFWLGAQARLLATVLYALRTVAGQPDFS